jgi:fumarate reductase flavoprotein subunit
MSKFNSGEDAMSTLKQNITRRDFIKGAAVTVAAVGGGGVLAACSPQVASPTSVPAATQASTTAPVTATAEIKADQTIETQVVVVGSGLGGLTAAISAMEEGATKVVLLEKESGYGGGTNFAECNGPASATEAEARQAAASAAKSTNYVADPMLHYRLAVNKKDDTDWLFTKHAVKVYKAGPYFYEGGNGSSAVKTLVPQATSLGVDMRLNTQAISLLTSDPYTVIGVRAKDADGKIIDFKAKAVVLATGGMSTNRTLLADYSSVDLEKVITNGAPAGQDGDGQKMIEATAHGRATHICVSSLFLNVKGFAYSSPMGVCAGMQPTNLWVNQDGLRFIDESIVSNTADCNKVVETQGSVFSIMDQDGFDKYAAGGCQTHYSGFADKYVGKPIADLAGDFAKYKDLPDVFTADTLDDLVKKMGIDAATFKATIEKYNGFAVAAAAAAPTTAPTAVATAAAAASATAAAPAAPAPAATVPEAVSPDVDWGKKAENIWPIAKAPFYAFRLSSGMLNTNGGARINTDAQVVDERYKPITGLYATGILTSGWQGEVYLGGTCQPVALWGGRRAAKHIAANLLKS